MNFPDPGDDMTIGTSSTARPLTQSEVRGIMAEALDHLELDGQRILVIIPDGTRTAPIPLMRRLFSELVGSRVKKIDYLVALGTHPPMDDGALSRLLGTKVINGKAGSSQVFNHRWDV